MRICIETLYTLTDFFKAIKLFSANGQIVLTAMGVTCMKQQIVRLCCIFYKSCRSDIPSLSYSLLFSHSLLFSLSISVREREIMLASSSVKRSIRPSVRLSVCLSVCLSLSLSLSLSLPLSPSHED